MARVNHKKVRELVSEKRKTITDRQFFSSRLFAGHLADIALAQTKRYNFSRRVKVQVVWKPRNPDIAYTAFDVIWINAGHRMVTCKKTRVERYEVIVGLFAHELGHVFYTPFPMRDTFVNFFKKYKWYPEKPTKMSADEKKNAAAMWKYCKENEDKREAMYQLLRTLHNAIEDGYVDSRMMDRYPGALGHGLQVLNETQFDMTPTLTQMIEAEGDGSHIWSTIQNLISSYCLWGEIKYGEETTSDERVQVVFSLLDSLDKAMMRYDGKERYRAVNRVVLRCWSYISDFLEHCEAMASATSAAGTATSIAGAVSAAISAVPGAGSIPMGKSAPVDDGSSKNSASAADKRAETAKKAAESGNPSDANEHEKEPEENEDEDKEEEAEGESADPEDDDDTDEQKSPFDKPLDRGASEAQEVTSTEKGRIPLHNTSQLSEPTGGGVSHDEEYTGSGYTHAAEDVTRLLESIAEKEVQTDLETARTAALNELAQSISYGDIHKGVDFTIHRIADVTEEMVEDYRDIAPDLLHISKLLKRSILQQLTDRQRGGKQTGLLMGRRLDSKALHKNDGKLFYKTNLPNDRPEMSIALLLDESGSMSSCHRATYARAAAIILYDFCRSLNIPIMVYGHSTSNNGVDLYSYAEFDSIDNDDCIRMVDISARGSNRDGAALRFVAEQLNKRPEDFKLLILVSDGQPADWGYDGTAAEEDLRGIKQEYKRKGVTFIAAAIGEDRENIKRIYGASYMDITDLTKLPVKLTEVVKKNLRVA